MAWDGVRQGRGPAPSETCVGGAHNPEVAGSNPAPATNVATGERPFPLGKGPLACVARDQDGDRGVSAVPLRLTNGTHGDWSGHLRCDRWVETHRSHPVRQPSRRPPQAPSSKCIAKTAASPRVRGLTSGTVPQPDPHSDNTRNIKHERRAKRAHFGVSIGRPLR